MRRLNMVCMTAGLSRGPGCGEPASLASRRGTGRPVADRCRRRGCRGKKPAKELTGPSIQDALLRNYHFRFERPASLNEVVQRLSQDLGSPVVLDLAALERQEVKPDDKVKLELDGSPAQDGPEALAGPGPPDREGRSRG